MESIYRQSVRDSWKLLEAIDPLFQDEEILPTIALAIQGQYGPLQGQRLAQLKNSITKLRIDMQFSTVLRHDANIDLLDEEDTHRLPQHTCAVLEIFESLVKDQVLSLHTIKSLGITKIQVQLQGIEEVAEPGLQGEQEDDGWDNLPSPGSLNPVCRFISHPKLLQPRANRWKIEAQAQYLTEADVMLIRETIEGEKKGKLHFDLSNEFSKKEIFGEKNESCHKSGWFESSFMSSWIHRHWRHDAIYISQCPQKLQRLDQLQLRMPCTLYEGADKNEYRTEAIASFGVLLLELEANEIANWEDDDKDIEYGTLSNKVRLGRLLREWQEDVTDDYRNVSWACLDFDRLVNGLDNPKVDRRDAVMYKCIFEPLFKLLIRDFSKTTSKLFRGVEGPWENILQRSKISPSHFSKTKVSKHILFDDHDDPGNKEKWDPSSQCRAYADKFMDGLNLSLQQVGGMPTIPDGKRIRIAVLDSGVRSDERKIETALREGRIKEIKSWVDSEGDTHGHGTIITGLLLKMAPAAHIYVGKICDGKTIEEEHIPFIGEAIRWAVEKWKVDIISLSLGSEERHEAIESAVSFATGKGVMIFAAASNNGALTERARPARRDDVFCIHASDGLGNKGNMNPTPQEGTRNFSTFGVAVPARYDGKMVCKSGTSFATPIAAGFAATILHFIQTVDYEWSIQDRKMFYRKDGMQKIFVKMSERRDGYDFVNLAQLPWGGNNHEVARILEGLL
ncbi:hypothetical protein FACUT_8303 [Fusarium acutatum]|uniref:Peptidase S8/S53 domain-containing protein n=1 Tax=Fusarium acutatum TaxID=78861 RepID=A0A8H4JJS1_9HYPO|nr:hypothetical protein FACUT_8303 [Fusarium acutatum]